MTQWIFPASMSVIMRWKEGRLKGFVRYNGMTAEKLALAVIRSEYLMPKRLVFKAENLYAKALEHSSVKEAIAHD